uniref:Protein kinase domain-containing protein n=1 Tax=Davidia involucrata TaxID=16924 RepID=A0A5B7C8D1_DAVIN
MKFMGSQRGKSYENGQLSSSSSSSSFLRNGSMLLEELIASCNGRYNIPIRNFSAKDLLKATNNFEEHQFIRAGAGDYEIYKGFLEERPILVKKFKNYSTPSYAIRDVVIMSQMSNHKNVARLFGYCLEFEIPVLVYDYSGDEPLSNFLYNIDEASGHEDKLLSWKSRLRIAKDIANAVTYLHTALSRPVVNRDLKPSKIMVDQYGVAKLFDFSLSISIPLGESHVEDDPVGTFGFLDPQYHISCFVTEKSDVYSFGMFLLVLLTGQLPISVDRKEAGLEFSLINFVEKHVDMNQFTKILDPRILGGRGGIEQEQQLRAFLALALRCIEPKGEDRPEMIDVAKELRQIERSVHP